MKLIKFLQDIPGDGYAKGSLVEVDNRSAASLIDRGLAKEYEPPAEVEAVEPVLTIDDIVDPEVAKKRAHINTTIVGGFDPGPSATLAVVEPPSATEDGTGSGTLAVDPDAPQTPAQTAAAAKKAAAKAATSPEQAATGADPAGTDAGGTGSGN